MRGTVLIYNSNTEIAEVMRPLLAEDGLETVVIKETEEIERRLECGQICLVITDIAAQGSESITPVRRIREQSSIPVIVLSGREDWRDKIGALDAGADDYLIYPCNSLELLARIRARIRRYSGLADMGANIRRIYRVKDLMLDDMERKVTVRGREVSLTPIEYKILRLLMQGKGRVFSIGQIYETVWHMRAVDADNTVAVHIRHIRKKIEADPGHPQYLKVVWGTGYCLSLK